MKNILTPDGWVLGRVIVDPAGLIARIEGTAVPSPIVTAGYVLPGFIDLHVHGGGGMDFMEGETAAYVVAKTHAGYGTTSFLATTMTAPEDELKIATESLGAAIRKPRGSGMSRILGVHLEGPFLNPNKLGSQPPHTRRAASAELDELLNIAHVRLVTLAPEIEGQLAIIRKLVERGIRVQLGHSTGTYEQGLAALKCGATGFAHLFNAMSGMHHRNPGIVGAAFAHAEYAEMIPDLLHVHPGAVKAAFRAIPKLYCITDSCSAVGMGAGEFTLGAQKVFRRRCESGVRLADGTLAASTLTMDEALRNLVSLGMTIADASDRLSRFPADFLGLQDRGRLAPGAWGDYVVLDHNLALEGICIEGEHIKPASKMSAEQL